MKFILASASPRRRELLEMLDIAETAAMLSRAKAREVAARRDADDVVIAADTVVWLDGRLFGKPKDTGDAARMLRALSGRAHTVYTGVTVMRGGEAVTETEATEVRFRELADAEIEAYIATGEPMDKAGAYGAQGKGALFVEGITGDFFNVMGLPLCRLGKMLRHMGVSLL